MFRLSAAICALLLLTACSTTSVRTETSGNSSSQLSDNPRLYLFNCGELTLTDVTAFGLTNEQTSVREMFVPCYLIEHKGQRLFWDGGLPLNLAGAGLQELPEFGLVKYDVSVIDQLASMGITPEEIDFAAFSHFHFDHVGAANALSESHLLIQEAEYQAAFNHAEDNPVFDPRLYDGLRRSEKTLLNGDHDVFGDGKVMIYSAPGHTPGHQVLLVRLSNFGNLILSGDLYHFVASRKLQSVPLFNSDAEQTRDSMRRVEALVKENNATFWIEHNKALADTLKKAPAFYD